MSAEISAKRGALTGPGGSYYPDIPRFRSGSILPVRGSLLQVTSSLITAARQQIGENGCRTAGIIRHRAGGNVKNSPQIASQIRPAAPHNAAGYAGGIAFDCSVGQEFISPLPHDLRAKFLFL